MTHRALLQRRLAVAAGAIAEGEKLIAAQLLLLERAHHEGRTGTAHTARLRQLKQTQAVHLVARDRLRAELHAVDENPRCAELRFK